MTQIQLFARMLIVLALWPAAARCDSATAISYDPSTYAQASGTKAIVLVSANWGRQWKCGQFDNARLQSLLFDRMDAPRASPDAAADFTLEDASIFPASTSFVDYAFVVEPGAYLLSGFRIKAARSTSDVGHVNGNRTTLIADGKSKAGSFVVGPGEVVYIGHFALDCALGPMPWRYYLEDRQSFEKYLALIKKKAPSLDVSDVKYRLFETSTMGRSFVLP